jgi:hypothetical protein
MVELLFETNKQLKVVDCRELEHPEPMVRVLEAVTVMEDDMSVLMVHRKEPFPLYSKLEERNCSHETKTSADGTVQVLIWKNK